jgi:hypothetical protein
MFPGLQLFRDIILLPKLEKATEEVLETLQKDVPGLNTFLGYRVFVRFCGLTSSDNLGQREPVRTTEDSFLRETGDPVLQKVTIAA